METHVNEVILLLCRITEVRGMKVSLTHSVRAALMTGLGAVVGGLVGGRLGFAVGSALGGLVGRRMGSDEFKPVSQIILELPPKEKKRLYDRASAVVWNLYWMDMAQLTALVKRNADIREELFKVVVNYLKELGAKIKIEKKSQLKEPMQYEDPTSCNVDVWCKS